MTRFNKYYVHNASWGEPREIDARSLQEAKRKLLWDFQGCGMLSLQVVTYEAVKTVEHTLETTGGNI